MQYKRGRIFAASFILWMIFIFTGKMHSARQPFQQFRCGKGANDNRQGQCQHRTKASKPIHQNAYQQGSNRHNGAVEAGVDAQEPTALSAVCRNYRPG